MKWLGPERIETGTSRLGMAYSAEGRAPYSQFGLLCNSSRFVGNTSVTGLEKVWPPYEKNSVLAFSRSLCTE